MTTKQDLKDLLSELYDGKQITITGYYAMGAAISQLKTNKSNPTVKP